MSAYTDYVNRLGRTAESDECYTPADDVAPLIPFLDPSKTYYEATSGISSSIVDGLTRHGIFVEPSKGRDFFECGPDDIFDGVVTNPPYSLKDKFLIHCYELGKPFALLLPVAAFQGRKRGAYYRERGLSSLVYNRRVDFTGKKAPPFGVAWFMGNGMEEYTSINPHGKLWFADN